MRSPFTKAAEFLNKKGNQRSFYDRDFSDSRWPFEKFREILIEAEKKTAAELNEIGKPFGSGK